MFRRTIIAGIALFASAAVLSEPAHPADAVRPSQQPPVATDDKVDFATQVEPLLSRFGCNAGGCHGKASGQNGFKLSLFGFDAEFDYEAIVDEARGRRIFGSAAENSLMLRKATGKVPHGGGKRLEPGSEPYQILHRWITQGAPASAPDAPRVTKIAIEPGERVMSLAAKQQLKVVATYSNGATRDVTSEAQYDSNMGPVAAVSGEGLVECGTQSGEAAVMARYMGQVAVFRALVQRGKSLAAIQNFHTEQYIERLFDGQWK